METWYLSVFAGAALLAVPLVIAAQRAGRALGMIDRPREGELQTHEVPRTGGYGIFLAFWLALLWSFVFVPSDLERLPADNLRLVGVFLGSLALLPLAALDDVRGLGPGPQLAGQVVAATLPTLFGVGIDQVATPFGPIAVPYALAGPLAVVWIVGMINAINLLDSLDGLAGGVATIACAVLFFRTLWLGQASIAILPLALAGASLGFLTQNWHPSRVILGSSGSLLLGYLLGVLTIVGGAKIGTALLVLAVPIVDVAWVIYRRLSQGRSPLRGGDSEHLAHRLRMLGLSDRQIVMGVYAVCAIIGAAVLSTHTAMPTMGRVYLIGFVVVGVLLGIAFVGRLAAKRAARGHEQRPHPSPLPEGEGDRH